MTELSPAVRRGVLLRGLCDLVRAAHYRREFCRFADAPSPSLLERLLQREGGAAE